VSHAYADHFIAVHIAEMGQDKTYSQLSAESLAQPKNVALAGTVATVFKGETLRSMLLNAYGWWKVSQITYIASLIAFGLGGLTALGTGAALAFGRKTQAEAPRSPDRSPSRSHDPQPASRQPRHDRPLTPARATRGPAGGPGRKRYQNHESIAPAPGSARQPLRSAVSISSISNATL
jgi:hypothetical protein